MHFLTVFISQIPFSCIVLFTWNGFSSFIYLKATHLSLLTLVSITHELLLEVPSLISSLFLNYYSTNIHTQEGIWVR